MSSGVATKHPALTPFGRDLHRIRQLGPRSPCKSQPEPSVVFHPQVRNPSNGGSFSPWRYFLPYGDEERLAAESPGDERRHTMARVITQRDQPLDVTSSAVLRIMRFVPVTIPMALHIEPTMSPGALRGGPGGRVTVGGTIKAGGFGARLTYRRVERGTSLPLEETSSERIALLHDRSLSIQPQALDWAEVGRPPDLWIQYVGGGSPLAPRTRLGRCDQGPFDLNPSLPLNLFVDAMVVRGEVFD